MSTTVTIDVSKWPAADNVTGPVTLTYDGASPADSTPGGAVLRMLAAQLANDREALAAAVTPATMEMGQPSFPGKKVEAVLSSAAIEGDTATVPAKVTIDGQEQPIEFLVAKDGAAWRVDMPATIQRLMGASMEQLTGALEEGMQLMAQGMAAAMDGVGEAMTAALGGTSAEESEVRPEVEAFRRAVGEMTGVQWRIHLDEDAFAAVNPELLQDIFDDLLEGVRQVANDPGVGLLFAVETVEITRHRAPKRMQRDGKTLKYTVGQTGDGRSDFYDRLSAADALKTALA